jgi:hypothetical protein
MLADVAIVDILRNVFKVKFVPVPVASDDQKTNKVWGKLGKITTNKDIMEWTVNKNRAWVNYVLWWLKRGMKGDKSVYVYYSRISTSDSEWNYH